MTHAQVAHSSWRKETRYCFSFITFCKKQQAYFSALAFILPLLFSFVTMRISDFPKESWSCGIFLFNFLNSHRSIFDIIIFFRKPKVTRRIPQLLLVVQEKESPFFVSFIFHVWEHDFIVQVASCCIWDFHFLFSFRWRLRQTQTSVTRWIDGTWSLCKQKYFSVSFF